MTDEKTTTDAKLYELGYHIDSAITEEKVSQKVDAIKKILADNNVEIIKEGAPVATKLSYEITKAIAGKNIRFNDSYFGWLNFNATVEAIENIKEEIDGDDEIIRSLIVKTVDDEEHSTSKISTEEELEDEGEDSEKEKEEEKSEIKVKETPKEKPVEEVKKTEEAPVEKEDVAEAEEKTEDK